MEIFKDRIKQYDGLNKALQRKYNLVSTVRVLVFVGFIIAFIAFANYKMGLEIGITTLVFPFAFGLIVRWHQKIAYERKQSGILKRINEQEVSIAKGQLKNQDPGVEYLDKNHAYINDLDIFGSNSIFQLLNRTTTKGGKDKLAYWLSNHDKIEEIINRQEAVKELTGLVDWRQELQAKGLHFTMQETNSSELIKWIKTSNPVKRRFQVSAFLFPLLIISSIALNLLTNWPSFVTLILVLLSGFVLNRFQDRVKNLTDSVIKHVSVLGAYVKLIDQLENTSFSSKKLNKIKLRISHDGKNASEIIQDLYKILDFLNARSNFFYMIIDVVLLFDLHIIMRAENWKAKNKTDVSEWFDAISELEALSSIAGFSYSNEDFSFPQFSDESHFLTTENMGHPLIPKHERISNHYQLVGKGSISIITGSNMSGKSTFLRTLGVNIALAKAGAPVCASNMELSSMQVFTSMRTQDNLEEHVSSFYAELQRIKNLLGLVNDSTPVLFMLDEILKGTNSQDRHIGAVALARQLSKTNAFGLISTHDLTLGELSKSMSSIDNYSFNSEVKGDEIIFPYTLEKGVCQSFNASKLMEKIGIEL